MSLSDHGISSFVIFSIWHKDHDSRKSNCRFSWFEMRSKSEVLYIGVYEVGRNCMQIFNDTRPPMDFLRLFSPRLNLNFVCLPSHPAGLIGFLTNDLIFEQSITCCYNHLAS